MCLYVTKQNRIIIILIRNRIKQNEFMNNFVGIYALFLHADMYMCVALDSHCRDYTG